MAGQSKKLQHYRGLEVNLPILDEGRFAFTTDTRRLFIGSSNGNVEFLNRNAIDNVVSQISQEIVRINQEIENTEVSIEDVRSDIMSYISTTLMDEINTTINDRMADIEVGDIEVVRKGLESQLSGLSEAILGFATDSNKIFIGSTNGNIEIAKKKDIDDRGISVKDFGAKGDGATDDSDAIQNAITNNNNVYFPEGVYKVSRAIILDGGQYINNNGTSMRYANKRIEFGGNSRLIPSGNHTVFKIKGAGSIIEDMTIDVSSIGNSYTSSAFVMEAIGDWEDSAEANYINNLKIVQQWSIKKGVGVELLADGVANIYRNKFTNIDISDFNVGIKFTNTSPEGINSNYFDGSIWGSQRSLYVNGGGNIFSFNIQGTYRDTTNPEMANVYVSGERNLFHGLIYDIGTEQLTKYAYEFGADGKENTITTYYPPYAISPVNSENINYFQFEPEPEHIQTYLEYNPFDDDFEDFKNGGGKPLPLKAQRGIIPVNNSFGRHSEIISSITMTSTNLTFQERGLAYASNNELLRELFNPNRLDKDYTDLFLFKATNVSSPANLTITINLDTQSSSSVMLRDFGLISVFNSPALNTGNRAVYSVKSYLYDNTEVTLDRFYGQQEDYHINNHQMFVAPRSTDYLSNPVVRVVLSIDFKANTLTNANAINYIYGNFIGSYGTSGSFAYIGGDKFGGDIEFVDDAGLVLKTPSGSDYKLEVKDDGGIQWKNRGDGSIINLPSSPSSPSSELSNIFNVKDFGAVGDGATDDSAVINNAISLLSSQGGGILRFDGGTYAIDSPILMKGNVTLQGVPNKTTLIASHSSMDGIRFQEATHNTEINGFIIRSVDGINTEFQNGGIYYGSYEMTNSTIRNVLIEGFCVGIDARTWWKASLVENVHIKNCRISVNVEQVASVNVSTVTFINLFSENPTYRHADLAYVEGFTFIGCRLQGDGTQADSITLIGGHATFIGCRFDGMDSTSVNYSMFYADNNAILNLENCYVIDYNSTATGQNTGTALFEVALGGRININGCGFEQSTGFDYLFRVFDFGRITYSNLTGIEEVPSNNRIVEGVVIDIDNVLTNGVNNGGGGGAIGPFEWRYNPTTNSLDLVVNIQE